MKDQMELTIGICVGSSIVSRFFIHTLPKLNSRTANCYLRRPAIGHRWMDVSFKEGNQGAC